MLQSTACFAAQFGWFWLIEPSPAVEVVEATVAQTAATTQQQEDQQRLVKNVTAVLMEAIQQDVSRRWGHCQGKMQTMHVLQ